MSMIKRYVVFGSGNYGRLALELLGSQNIDFFIDNDIDKQGKSLDGVKIISLDQALLRLTNQIVVIAASELYYDQIQKQLDDSGIKNYVSVMEIQRSITKEKILARPDYLTIYNKAIEWIKNNTIENAGIINNSMLRKPYPEVTGYYIPTLIRWGYRVLAEQYANWLMEIQKEDGSWYDTDNQSPYIFDTAQILKGLLAIWDIHSDKVRVEESIKKGADWILSCMTEEGRLVAPDECCWSENEDTCSELIHTYCISPIIEAGKRMKNDGYIQKAHRILDYYKKKYETKILNFSLLSHFYAYVVEAMLDLGEIEIARQAMDHITEYQKSSGAVPAYNNVDWVCSTGLLQLSLIWFRLGDEKHGNKAFEYACKLQNESGGWFGSYLSEENQNEINTYFPKQEISWANKYFLDALYYKNLCQFQNTASIFCNEISTEDGRYNIIKNVVSTSGKIDILDLGCGKGRYLKRLVESFPDKNYHAVDLSTNVMQYFSVLEGVEKRQGSLTNIPYKDNSFDVVYTCEALEHAVDIDRAIGEMARVTKQDGTIVVIDKNKDMYGYFEIGEWEQWFGEQELSDIMQRYCSEVHVEKEISFDNNKANGLFYAWIGKVRL